MRFLFVPSLRLLKKATLLLVSSIFVLGIFAFFALSPILKTLTEKQLAKMLHREVSVQKLDFNLLTLQAQIEG